jgi:hypothetical protein
VPGRVWRPWKTGRCPPSSLPFPARPTATHSLLAGSAAINKGSNPLGLAFDQRGPNFARIRGRLADIGAFES